MINDIQVKINQLSADFEGIVKDAYSTPISPSNRRYLEVLIIVYLFITRNYNIIVLGRQTKWYVN